MRTPVLVGVVVLVAACRDKDPRPRPAPPPQAPADAAAPLDQLPASARASIASPPRDQWACAFEVVEDQGIHERGHATLHYGKRTRCQIPLSLLVQGVWGCPDYYMRVDESDGMQREHAFTYDDHDRITELSVQLVEHFTWDGDRLAATAREQWGTTDTATYRDRGPEVIAVDDKGQLQEVLAFEHGVVTRFAEYLYGSEALRATLTWADGRPQHVGVEVLGPIRGHVSRTFHYDCTPPPIATPVTAEFVRFENVDKPGKLQRYVMRLHNTGTRPVGAIQWEARYRSTTGAPVLIDTNLGPADHDASAWVNRDPLVGPGETKDIAFTPNYGPIPPTAVRVEIRLTEICESRRLHNGLAKGECWWTHP